MRITLRCLAVTAMALVVLFMVATGVANAQPPKCDTQIIACGCTIGAPGSYTVENTLYASQGLTLKNSCIEIEGENINLYVLDYDIVGPGSNSSCTTDTPHKNSGAGIHVLPSASNVVIDEYEYVCGWNYGVESEGSNINLYALSDYYNNVGTFLNNATNNACLYCYSYHNVIGTQISGGSGNSDGSGQNYYNTKFGYWIDGSKHNAISNDYAYYNGTGFYLGCSSSGAVNPQILCPKNTPTTGNSLVSNEADHNTGHGFATERGAIYNNYQENSTDTSIVDGNGNCIYNNYVDNTYSSKSPSCIM